MDNVRTAGPWEHMELEDWLMKTTTRHAAAITSAATLAAASTLIARSAPSAGGPFELVQYTVDCGGGTSTGGVFEMSGTIGQSDASPASVGAAYQLTGGFFAGAGLPAAEPCPGDLDDDGLVDAADLAQVLAAWGPAPGSPADLDGDDDVAASDLAMLLAAWGVCP